MIVRLHNYGSEGDTRIDLELTDEELELVRQVFNALNKEAREYDPVLVIEEWE
jgi:hypothetical protein